MTVGAGCADGEGTGDWWREQSNGISGSGEMSPVALVGAGVDTIGEAYRSIVRNYYRSWC